MGRLIIKAAFESSLLSYFLCAIRISDFFNGLLNLNMGTCGV